MKLSNQTRRRWIGWMTALIALAALAGPSAISTSATIITLAGGDPGEGFSPLPAAAYAYNLRFATAGIVSTNIQSVTFVPVALGAGSGTPVSFPNFSLGDYQTYDGGSVSDIGATSHDEALEYVNRGFAFADGGGLTLSLTNLNAGQTYQVDLFVSTGDGSSYQENFLFNGGQANSFLAAPSTYYNVRESVVANGSGAIIVQLSPFPARLNAFAVTTIPEPSTVCLLGFGGWLAWRRARRCSPVQLSSPGRDR